jgi:hypothetical protein
VAHVIATGVSKPLMAVVEIAKSMECGESSPLFFLETESGEDSRRSIRFAIWVTAIAVFNEISQARHRDGMRRVKGAEIAKCPPRGLTANDWFLCQIWIRKRRSE